MGNFWKITNTGKSPKVKITIALSSDKSPGLFLNENEYVITQPRMTTMLDAQHKRGYVAIDKNFDNSRNLEIGKVIKMTPREIAEQKVHDYKK